MLQIQPSYTVDLLNLLNTLTGDPFCVECHPEDWDKFGKGLSLKLAQQQSRREHRVLAGPDG
jgi:hypothetical protein